MAWNPRSPEFLIPYDPEQLALYRRQDPTSVYWADRWPRSIGRSRHGESPLVVVSHHLRLLGYTVWAAEPELPDNTGFMLVSFPGKRRRLHPAYVRMEGFFDRSVLARLNSHADAAKKKATGNASGGDPDLFAFNTTERFFVEVKWKDSITKKQAITFPLIEGYCGTEVKLARIVPVVPAV